MLAPSHKWWHINVNKPIFVAHLAMQKHSGTTRGHCQTISRPLYRTSGLSSVSGLQVVKAWTTGICVSSLNI